MPPDPPSLGVLRTLAFSVPDEKSCIKPWTGTTSDSGAGIPVGAGVVQSSSGI